MNNPESKSPPLPLPRFTFLCGSANDGREELATALCSLDPDLCLEDFEEPLRMATLALFENGYNGNNELLGDRRKQQIFPNGSTYDEFLEEFRECLDKICGGAALAQIAIKNLEQDVDIFPRHIYRDCEDSRLIVPFVQKYGPESCLQIFCGTMLQFYTAKTLVRTIVLPEPDLEKRIEYLRRELTARPI